jgi:hypothetical protein
VASADELEGSGSNAASQKSSTNSPTTPTFGTAITHRSAWHIENSTYVSRKGEKAHTHSCPTPQEFHERLWSPEYGRGGAFLGETVIVPGIPMHGFSSGVVSIGHQKLSRISSPKVKSPKKMIICNVQSRTTSRKQAKSDAKARADAAKEWPGPGEKRKKKDYPDPNIVAPRYNESIPGWAYEQMNSVKALPEPGTTAAKVFYSEIKNVPLPDGIEIPNAVFARKHDLVPEGGALPIELLEKQLQLTADRMAVEKLECLVRQEQREIEEDIGLETMFALNNVEQTQDTSSSSEFEMPDALKGAREKAKAIKEKYKFRGPFTPGLFYDGGLDFKWELPSLKTAIGCSLVQDRFPTTNMINETSLGHSSTKVCSSLAAIPMPSKRNVAINSSTLHACDVVNIGLATSGWSNPSNGGAAAEPAIDNLASKGKGSWTGDTEGRLTKSSMSTYRDVPNHDCALRDKAVQKIVSKISLQDLKHEYLEESHPRNKAAYKRPSSIATSERADSKSLRRSFSSSGRRRKPPSRKHSFFSFLTRKNVRQVSSESALRENAVPQKVHVRCPSAFRKVEQVELNDVVKNRQNIVLSGHLLANNERGSHVEWRPISPPVEHDGMVENRKISSLRSGCRRAAGQELLEQMCDAPNAALTGSPRSMKSSTRRPLGEVSGNSIGETPALSLLQIRGPSSFDGAGDDVDCLMLEKRPTYWQTIAKQAENMDDSYNHNNNNNNPQFTLHNSTNIQHQSYNEVQLATTNSNCSMDLDHDLPPLPTKLLHVRKQSKSQRRVETGQQHQDSRTSNNGLPGQQLFPPRTSSRRRLELPRDSTSDFHPRELNINSSCPSSTATQSTFSSSKTHERVISDTSSVILGNFMPLETPDTMTPPTTAESNMSPIDKLVLLEAFREHTNIHSAAIYRLSKPIKNPYEFEPYSPQDEARLTTFTDFMKSQDEARASSPRPFSNVKNSRSEGNEMYKTRRPEPLVLIPPKPSCYIIHRSESSPSVSPLRRPPRRDTTPSPELSYYFAEDEDSCSPPRRGRQRGEEPTSRSPSRRRRQEYVQSSFPQASTRERLSRSPTKTLDDVVERDEVIIRFPSLSPSPSPPKRRSRSPMKKMFGDHGWLGHSTDPKEKAKPRPEKFTIVPKEHSTIRHKKSTVMGKIKNKFEEFVSRITIAYQVYSN